MQLTFCELQARESLARSLLGSAVPRKMGLNWFIPALANSRVGSLTGTTAELGQKVWPFDLKKSTKVVRTLAPLHSTAILTDCRRGAELTQRALLNAPRCVRVSVTRIKK